MLAAVGFSLEAACAAVPVGFVEAPPVGFVVSEVPGLFAVGFAGAGVVGFAAVVVGLGGSGGGREAGPRTGMGAT
ncbi:hypothetical protein F0U62_34380 [Cystobacter fuscus]|uniref:hypothetical protein n=1 Tax=Cystobacter fuscus TaxID=43 RepID=UPI002B2BFD82|nr:hypothetical protein F0U62_34380 [Cystobacter fuscus]